MTERLHIELVDGDPGRALGAIITELIGAGVAFGTGNPAKCRRRLKRAAVALDVLRVLLDTATKLPRR